VTTSRGPLRRKEGNKAVPIEVKIEIRAQEILDTHVFCSKHEHVGYAAAMHDPTTKSTEAFIAALRPHSVAWRDFHAGWLAWEIECS
jgi:hypothetical protein